MKNENFCNGNCHGCERFEEEQGKTAGEEGAEEETWGRSKENIQEEEFNKFLREFKKKKEEEKKKYKKKKSQK